MTTNSRRRRRTRENLVFGMETAHIIIMSSCIIYDGETIPYYTDKCSFYCRVLMLTSPPTTISFETNEAWLAIVCVCVCVAKSPVCYNESITVGLSWDWQPKKRLFFLSFRNKSPTKHFDHPIHRRTIYQYNFWLNGIRSIQLCWCGKKHLSINGADLTEIPNSILLKDFPPSPRIMRDYPQFRKSTFFSLRRS